MNKKEYKRLLKQAVKEHAMEDYAKIRFTPGYIRAMKKIGRQRLCCNPNEDDKKQAI